MSTLQASGFGQIPPEGGLARNDAVAKFELGTVVSDTFGNSYRYIQASDTLFKGGGVTAVAKTAWDGTIVMDGAVAVADLTNIIHVDTLANAMTVNQYAGYWVSQASAAGLGRGMRIHHHAAQTAAGDELDIYLEDLVPEALGDGAVLSIYNPYLMMNVAAVTQVIMGIAIGTITATYFGFIQVGGHCPAVYVGGTTNLAVILNEPLTPGATIATDMIAGALMGIEGSTEVDIMEAAASPVIALQAVAADTAGYIEAFIKGLV